jgi:uncharacterized protein YegP (UPF0339 family)
MIKIHSKKGHHWFTVCGRNGHVFATSETYTRRSNCIKAAKDLLKMLGLAYTFIKSDTPVKKKPNPRFAKSNPEDQWNEF